MEMWERYARQILEVDEAQVELEKAQEAYSRVAFDLEQAKRRLEEAERRQALPTLIERLKRGHDGSILEAVVHAHWRAEEDSPIYWIDEAALLRLANGQEALRLEDDGREYFVVSSRLIPE